MSQSDTAGASYKEASSTVGATLGTETALARRRVPWWVLLIMVSAVAAQVVRIVTVHSATGEVPFHSANDRSRWCAVAAIVEKGQFEIDDYLEIRSPTHRNRRLWATIDLVRHRGKDGKQHYYSSKPPLLLVIHASAYGALRAVTGLTLTKQVFTTARAVLILVNLIPLAIFWWMWLRYWRRQSMSDWGLTLLVLFMTWGTFVSTFCNTLNNHLPGALAAGVTLWSLLKIIEEQRTGTHWFVLAAFAAAMSAVCELPALAWAAATLALLVQIDVRKTIVAITLGMVPVAIAFAIVNYAAHGDLRPPYAHRAAGPLVTTVELPAPTAADQLAERQPMIVRQLRQSKFDVSDSAIVRPTRTEGVQELWDESTQFRFALILSGDKLAIHHWDDWYDYPGSYWYPDRKKGVDRGEPSRLKYLFHTTIGHHGVFSLTPMWLLIPMGAWCVWSGATGQLMNRLFSMRVQLMLAITATSLVCFVFYMLRPLEDRNYGGVSCGFRWMFWFIPLWMWLVGQSLMDLRRKWAIAVVLLLLSVSVYSANYPWSNPWTTPWQTQFYPVDE